MSSRGRRSQLAWEEGAGNARDRRLESSQIELQGSRGRGRGGSVATLVCEVGSYASQPANRFSFRAGKSTHSFEAFCTLNVPDSSESLASHFHYLLVVCDHTNRISWNVYIYCLNLDRMDGRELWSGGDFWAAWNLSFEEVVGRMYRCRRLNFRSVLGFFWQIGMWTLDGLAGLVLPEGL